MEMNKLLFSGINADYYEYENKIVKLFKKGQKEEFVLNEYNKAMELNSLDFAPKAVSMINLFGREGIVFEMMKGNAIIDLSINATDPIYCAETIYETIESVGKNASIHLSSYKDILRKGIEKAKDSNEVSTEIYSEAINILNSLPESGRICNSMIEPNNIILNKGNIIIPEWDLVCCGPIEYELARTYINLNIRRYPEKGYNKDSVKNFLMFTYQALCKKTAKSISDIVDFVYVTAVSMLGEYLEYESDLVIKKYLVEGEF